MKTAIGYLAILLGVAGVILCLAAAVLAWWAAARVKNRTDLFTAQADQGLGRVENALTRMHEKAQATAEAVESVRASAARVEAGAEVEPAVAASIERMLNSLMPLLERAASFGEVLRSVAVILANAAGASERLGQDRARAEGLRSTADTISAAAGTIDTVRDRIEALRSGDAAPTAAKLAELAERARPPLNQLATGLSDVRQRCTDAREELADVRRQVHFWAVAGPALLNLALLWAGLGQLCLIGWGRQHLAARSSAQGAPPPEAGPWSPH